MVSRRKEVDGAKAEGEAAAGDAEKKEKAKGEAAAGDTEKTEQGNENAEGKKKDGEGTEEGGEEGDKKKEVKSTDDTAEKADEKRENVAIVPTNTAGSVADLPEAGAASDADAQLAKLLKGCCDFCKKECNIGEAKVRTSQLSR